MSRAILGRRARRGLAAAGLGSLALTGCVPPAPEPTPAPSPTQIALPEPEPTAPILLEIPTPTYENWMDAPATPGDWSYSSQPAESLATFGPSRDEPLLMLRCDRTTRRVGLARVGEAPGPVQLRILAETAERTMTATPFPGQMDLLVAEFAAADPLLDAIAFSKGRFAVEAGGQAPLFLPAWPEVTRVIEDCRR